MLKPDTEAVWQFLRRQPGLTGFVLMGGSALALRLGHRQSEDLDFVWPGSKLPRDRLEALRRAAVAAGMAVVPHDDPTALREFADGGLDLLDFQQDCLMGQGVKVTFFSPEPSALAVLEGATEAPTSGPRLASLPEGRADGDSGVDGGAPANGQRSPCEHAAVSMAAGEKVADNKN
ncbi:MAG: nucleotidyl transferase AbiEii/AbiGii toxin family protein [Verrucomicrobia bacterium]|nr:nucleotidyl transferase AbiEii/AbiGii toxin family protein [Verrucomicrobiota bacterium]